MEMKPWGQGGRGESRVRPQRKRGRTSCFKFLREPQRSWPSAGQHAHWHSREFTISTLDRTTFLSMTSYLCKAGFPGLRDKISSTAQILMWNRIWGWQLFAPKQLSMKFYSRGLDLVPENALHPPACGSQALLLFCSDFQLNHVCIFRHGHLIAALYLHEAADCSSCLTVLVAQWALTFLSLLNYLNTPIC